jgi:DNA-binding MarR family transcriptional regulator
VLTDSDTARRALLTQIALLGPLRREMARCVVPHLHEGAATVAWHLSRHGPLRMTQLAAALQLDTSVVSRQVADLVAAGHAERQVDERDRRACRISLTPTGQTALDAALDRLDARFRDQLDTWEAGELQQVAEHLKALREQLVPPAPRTPPDDTAA